jgi:hypothetical protein
MSDGKRKAAEKAGQGGNFHEKRSYERYRIPAVYQRYISLRVKNGESLVPSVLLNFSRHGVMFESAAAYEEGSLAEGVISAPKLLTKDIAFSFRVKYCKPGNSSFEIGAEIESLADEVWFNIFMEVHDFIVARKGDIY